jgi:monothiol glutaredoxin
MTTEDKIRQQISDNPVLIYMKGTPEKPECGFSARAAQILTDTGIDYAFVNVLQSPFIYERLPAVSQFPTYPQVFIGGELIGGSDIVAELMESGELMDMLQAAKAAKAAAAS